MTKKGPKQFPRQFMLCGQQYSSEGGKSDELAWVNFFLVESGLETYIGHYMWFEIGDLQQEYLEFDPKGSAVKDVLKRLSRI